MRLILTALLAAASITAMASPADAKLGQRYKSEMKIINDPVTGRKLHLMTNGAVSESKLYPTDQQWAYDGRHIIYRSSGRAPGEGSQIFALDDTTGDIVQITGGEGVSGSSIMVSRVANKVYYLRRQPNGRQVLTSIDLTSLLRDSAANRISEKGYDTPLFTLPEGFQIAGGFTIDANDKTVYFGFREPTPPNAPPPGPNAPRIAQGPGGLMAFDLATGASRVVVKTPFTVGHIQANPFKSGEIMYCNETGGDAATRMWITSADGHDNRPVYVEGPDDWVTHEQLQVNGGIPSRYYSYDLEPADVVARMLKLAVSFCRSLPLNVDHADMRVAHIQASIRRMAGLMGAEYVAHTRVVMNWIDDSSISDEEFAARKYAAAQQFETRILPHVFEWARRSFLRVEQGAFSAIEDLNDKQKPGVGSGSAARPLQQ